MQKPEFRKKMEIPGYYSRTLQLTSSICENGMFSFETEYVFQMNILVI
jgi:hypothetical protein